MRRLRRIGHSPVTPVIGAALAAVGAVALVGFALVAQVTTQDDGRAPDRSVVRSNMGSSPAPIVLPTPTPLTTSPNGEEPVSPTLPEPTTPTTVGFVPAGAVVQPPNLAEAAPRAIDPRATFGGREITPGLRPSSVDGPDYEGKGSKVRTKKPKKGHGYGHAHHSPTSDHGWDDTAERREPRSDRGNGSKHDSSGSDEDGSRGHGGSNGHGKHKSNGHGKNKSRGRGK